MATNMCSTTMTGQKRNFSMDSMERGWAWDRMSKPEYTYTVQNKHPAYPIVIHRSTKSMPWPGTYAWHFRAEDCCSKCTNKYVMCKDMTEHITQSMERGPKAPLPRDCSCLPPRQLLSNWQPPQKTRRLNITAVWNLDTTCAIRGTCAQLF